MPHLKWSKRAIDDLSRLRHFLTLENPEAAVRALLTIRQGVRILQKNPEAGRKIEYLPPEVREWVISFGKSAYIVRYQSTPKHLLILAVRHGREVGF